MASGKAELASLDRMLTMCQVPGLSSMTFVAYKALTKYLVHETLKKCHLSLKLSPSIVSPML